MVDIDPETEYRLNEIIDEFYEQEYEQGWISEALFVLALDLRQASHVDIQTDYPKINSAIRETMNSQQQWVIDELREVELPSGFSQQTSRGNVDVIDLNDPILDHEFFMYPGDDFFEVIVRQYYPVICEEYSIQSVAQKTRGGKNQANRMAVLLITQATSPGFSALPFFGLLALHLIEEGIDDICERYEPY